MFLTRTKKMEIAENVEIKKRSQKIGYNIAITVKKLI